MGLRGRVGRERVEGVDRGEKVGREGGEREEQKGDGRIMLKRLWSRWGESDKKRNM